MIEKLFKITNSENLIIVNNGFLSLYNYKSKYKLLKTKGFIGKNGLTIKKKEGDGKTPKGIFKLGIAFGMHDIKIDKSMKYIKINKNLYWIDDVNSKYYNKLVDITKVEKDWNTAEHLIEYKNQYEYGIEINTNKENIPGKGSAIFLHCTTGKPTMGCVAIEKEKMIELLEKINSKTVILIG